MKANSTSARTITLDDGRGIDEAMYVGPSTVGTVYRSTNNSAWYRLVPVGNASIEWRHSVRSQANQAMPGMLSAQRDWQQTVDGSTHLVFYYSSASRGQTLAELNRNADSVSRLRGAAAFVQMLPQWWQTVSPPLFPLPADVVVTEDGQARLLMIPRRDLPNSQDVFEEPQRALYLAPELLRSAADVVWDRTSWTAIDRYAAGVCLLECCFQLPNTSRVETVLFRGAAGSLLNKLWLRPDFPPWLEQFPHHRNTLILIRRLTSSVPSTRTSVDLVQLANQLHMLQQVFDPRTAVAWLRDRAQPKEALALLQELLARASASNDVQRQCDLFFLAGELCGKFLNQPLDAIDYFERAINLEPNRADAYREQLRIIAGARHHPALATIMESNPSVSQQVDAKLWRNYSKLYGTRDTYGDTDVEQMDDRLVARYAVWRRQYDVARDFIYPRLFDQDKTYVWWDFDLGLTYVHAFMGLASSDRTNLERATQQLHQIKVGLASAIQNGVFEETQMHQYGDEVADLEYAIFRIQSPQK